ncbi:MAG: hypothetical protein P1U32_06505 [Legionellaceae bacterium]|nr:hypothetical protein [Legionellaceae bacterium]
MKTHHHTFHGLSYVLLSAIACNAYSDLPNDTYASPEVPEISVQSVLNTHAPALLSDTAAASFTLTQGTASSREIGNLEGTGAAPGTGYYATSDCSGAFTGTFGFIIGTAFTFTDNQPIYVGQEALAALSAGDASTQCVGFTLNGNDGSQLGIRIRNLTCNGTTCSGGSACYTTPNNGRWGTATTPAC